MKTWTDTEGNVLYEHYEKPVSSRTVLHAMSAHSSACKRSVHTQEVLRRLLNCSPRLDWDTEVAPFVTDYMDRMRKAEYSETYRREVLIHAINIYDKKWKDHNEGTRPIHRPKDYQKDKRRREKEEKKHEWAKKDVHIAPISVPTTPGSELMKAMRLVAEKEAKEGIRFNIIEMGGRTLKREFQKSNPTAPPGCTKEDCLCCNEERGKGGQCHRSNVNYRIECKLCPEENRAVYIGETSRNLYTRLAEHFDGSNNDGSFMKKHMEEYHEGEEVNFEGRVTHSNKHCLTRQVREGVLIKQGGKIMNTKSEWHQPSIYSVRREVVRD